MISSTVIIVTDLDGTLLDHHSYSYSAATEALELVKQRNVPLILNSSKTASEVQAIRASLQNTEPYVVENGGGIIVPENATRLLSLESAGTNHADDNENTSRVREDQSRTKQPGIISLGMQREKILSILSDLRKESGYCFTGFADMSVDELVNETGLDKEVAVLAMQREFSEPLLWKDMEARFFEFEQKLEDRGLKIVKGGRFFHVASPVTKASPFSLLKKYYADNSESSPIVIALGDGENDVPMLEAADYPVLIPSPVNRLPNVKHEELMVAESAGPSGWNQAVITLLNKITA